MGFVSDIFQKIEDIAMAFKGYVSAFLAFLDAVEENYPGLVDSVVPFVDAVDNLIESAKDAGESEETIDAIKEEGREEAIEKLKEEFSASPRFVPTGVIRSTYEAIVYTKRYVKEKGNTKYDNAAIARHAREVLSGRR